MQFFRLQQVVSEALSGCDWVGARSPVQLCSVFDNPEGETQSCPCFDN